MNGLQLRRGFLPRQHGAVSWQARRFAPAWTTDELALLGTMPDENLAKRIGKTRDAVRAQKRRQKIAAAGGAKAGRPKKRKPKGD
jgi:hypothetical protein